MGSFPRGYRAFTHFLRRAPARYGAERLGRRVTMETKDLLGISLVALAIPIAILICCFSKSARDIAFFFLVSGTVLSERLDINFFSRYWYRGTTRGFEFTLLDVAAIGILGATLLFPKPGQKRCYLPAGLGLMILYLIYACFSV